MEILPTGLPEGVEDAVLNRGELARALGKSEPTITAWIGEGMPVLKEGTNGSAYEFQLSDCWRWLKTRERTERDKADQAQRAIHQMRLALVGGDGFGDEERGLSQKERQQLYDTERSFDLTAMARGDLVKRSDVVAVLEEVFLIVRDGVISLPDRLEREAGLSGKAVDLAIDICDSVLAEAQERVRERASGEDMKKAAE